MGQSFLFPWLTDSLEKKKALKNQESDHSLNSQEQKEKQEWDSLEPHCSKGFNTDERFTTK